MMSDSINPHIGKFVTSNTNDYGVGKIFDSNSEIALVEYFDSPVDTDHQIETVPFSSLKLCKLERQTRVYFHDQIQGFWRMGRIEMHVNGLVYIDLPNKESTSIPEAEAYVRWNRPLGNPWAHLESRLTETPFFHSARSSLVAAFIEQRAASAGMTGLLSAPVEIERHQVEVISRVLKDPCQRYLLADEVGLGKTIEAGIILRQHLIDNPDSHSVLIVVPEGLVSQWTSELYERCQISAEVFGHEVEIIPYSQVLDWQGESPDFIICDEAHQIVGDESLFDQIRQLSNPGNCPKLLLLSATPVLRNEYGFLALLHLLDPLVNKLEDIDVFRERVANRQDLANLFGEFVEDQDIFHLPVVIQDLKKQFPKDKRLSNLIEEVEFEVQKCIDQGVFENPPELKQIIGKARAHLSESYRLHRRVLRNRRDEDLNQVLTGRDHLEVIPFSDQSAVDLEEAIVNWRSKAEASLWGKPDVESEQESFAAIFLGLIQASSCDPEALLELVKLRKNIEIPDSRNFGPLVNKPLKQLIRDAPLFEEEVVALDRILALENRLEFSRKERLVRLGGVIRDVIAVDTTIKRLIFFATSPALADDLYEHLLALYKDTVVTRHSTRSSDWKSCWKRTGPQFLICDWTAEEGLNLQGGATCMIHVDLPFDPNRMEQRIGRLDRFGVGNPAVSFVLDTSECLFASAWRDCLDNGWEVFSNSIAALQYVVDEEMQQLGLKLFTEEVDAIKNATMRLSSKDGIQKELRLIRNQDALDAIETSYQEETEKLIEQFDEVSLNWKNFQDVINQWLLERLHFMYVGEDSKVDSVFRYHFRSSDKGPQTLISQEQFIRCYRLGIDVMAKHDVYRPPLSYAMSFSRQIARSRNVGFASIGTPWIDCLSIHLQEDDRGSAFALWRKIDSGDLFEGEAGRVFFRFDYMIEANMSEDSDASLKRKADAAFPPIYKTLWVDQDLEIPEGELLDWIEEPYFNKEDVNIRAEYWGEVMETLEIHDWIGLCRQVHSTAERSLREKTNLQDLVDLSGKQFSANTLKATEQAQSRLEIFGQEHLTLERDIEEQSRNAEIIADAIRIPRIRLDSCGVIFLSNINLKTEGDTE